MASGPLAEVRDVVKVPETVLVFAGERTGLTWRRERRRFCGELLVKVTDVFFAADGRDEGRGQLLLQQRLPVHALEGETEKRRRWVYYAREHTAMMEDIKDQGKNLYTR